MPSDALHQWLVCILFSLANMVITFWGVCGLIHYWFYVRKRAQAKEWKLQPNRWLSRKMVRHAFVLGTLNQLLAALLGATFACYILRGGWSQLYFEPGKYGLIYLPVSFVLGFLLIDAGLYYSHRLLHQRLLFRHIHRWHHRYVAPVVFTYTAVHPVELIILELTVFLTAFILPMHVGVYLALLAYTSLVGILDHVGARIELRLPLHGTTRFHDDHHIYFHCNYGAHTKLFDILHGTVRRTDREYGEEIYGGHGAARADSAAGGRQVRY